MKRMAALIIATLLVFIAGGCTKGDLVGALGDMSERLQPGASAPAETPSESVASATPEANATPVLSSGGGKSTKPPKSTPATAATAAPARTTPTQLGPGAIEKWSDATEGRSSLFNGGEFAAADSAFYMMMEDAGGVMGLYRVPRDGTAAQLVDDSYYGACNMTYHYPYGWDSGYIYYTVYRWDSDPGTLFRIKDGSTEAEELEFAIAEHFALLDGYIYYCNSWAPDLYDMDEPLKLYRAPADNLEESVVIAKFTSDIIGICEDGEKIYVTVETEKGSEITAVDSTTFEQRHIYTYDGTLLSTMVIDGMVYMKSYENDGDRRFLRYDTAADKLIEFENAVAVCANDLLVYILEGALGENAPKSGSKLTLYEVYAHEAGDRSKYSAMKELGGEISKGSYPAACYLYQSGSELMVQIYERSRSQAYYELSRLVTVWCSIR